MPPEIHAALASAANAAANLRAKISKLAAAVERGDEDIIVIAARALVTSDDASSDSHSPGTPEVITDPGPNEGESP